MRRMRIIGLMLVALLLLLLAPTASAQGPDGVNVGGLVFGGNRTIGEGQTYQGDMAVFGGNLTVRERARVVGDVVVFGGTVDINGIVEGNIFVIGGHVRLREGAVVEGAVNRIGGSLDQSSGAVVRQGTQNPSQPAIPVPPLVPGAPQAPTPPRQPPPRNIVGEFVVWVVQTTLYTLGLAVLAVVAMLLLPVHMRNVATTIRYNPAAATGMGALTWVVWVAAMILVALVSALLIIICIGLLGIPVLLILGLAFPIAALFGWLATGYLVGDGILRALRIQSSAPLIAAGIGTLVITGVHQVVDLVPCFGWLLSWLLTLPGLGAVVLTWFGTRAWRPGDPYLPGGLGPRGPRGSGPVPSAPGWSPPLMLDAGPTTPTAPPPASTASTPSPLPPSGADATVWGQAPVTPVPPPDVEVDQTAPPTPPLVDEPVPPPSPWMPPTTTSALLGRMTEDDSEPAPPPASVVTGEEPPSPWAPRQTTTAAPRPAAEQSKIPSPPPPHAPPLAASTQPSSPWSPRPTTTPAPRPVESTPPPATVASEPPSPWAPRPTTTPAPRPAAESQPPSAPPASNVPSSPWAPPPGRVATGLDEALRPSPLSPFFGGETGTRTPETPAPPPLPTQRDNLQALPLVGPTYEGLFNSRGVYGYAQLAALSPAEVRAMLAGPNVISVSEDQAQMMIDEAQRLSKA